MNPRGAPQRLDADDAGTAFDTHLRIDAAIDGTLGDLIVNTESSAMATMQTIRGLYDSATQAVGLANGADSSMSGLDADIVTIMADLMNVGSFVEQLPVRMQHDLANAQGVAKEMKDLSTLVEDVGAISVQSKILAINTAIEASRAGSAGDTFRVISEEMVRLALNTKKVATSIVDGLSRARHLVEYGVAASIAQSSSELDKVTHAAGSIMTLRQKLLELREQHRAQLATVGRHNEKLAADIADALGHIQYQDIVRQSIERIRNTIQARNACVEAAFVGSQGTELRHLPQQLEMILDEYVTIESTHTRAAQHTPDSSQRKIELF